MKILKKIIVILSFCLIASCATTEGADAFKNFSSKELYDSAEKSLAKKHYQDAVTRYEAMDALYPFETQTEQAQLDVIYAYYKADDPDSAVAAADRYVRMYPMSPHADYAYYIKGLINMERHNGWINRTFRIDSAKRDLTGLQEAFNDFRQLIRLYPESKYTSDAHKRMIYIRNILAKHELETADFYFQRKAYVAAANRANYIVKHLEGSVYVPKALSLMVKSYRALGEQALADETQRVLLANCPG